MKKILQLFRNARLRLMTMAGQAWDLLLVFALLIISYSEGEAPSAEHHLLNEVDSDTIAKVKELCGRDVSGYRHSVSAANIHHSMKKHPYLSDDDIMLLPDITSNYDKIRHEKRRTATGLSTQKPTEIQLTR